MNVLIADDEPANLEMLRVLLERAGHSVISACDGAEALQALEGEKIDAVISDILMPRLDGYRFCLEVRKNKKFGNVPFMFYTSTYTSADDEQTARKLGADRFLRKPAGSSQILGALNEAVQEKVARKAAARTPIKELDLVQEYSTRLVAKLEQRNLELERSEQEGRKSRAQLRALAARLEAAREEERIRIAREIHDDLGELLTGLKLGLGWIRSHIENHMASATPQGEELKRKIDELGTLADSTTHRVRKICTELRPSILDDLGLFAAIEWQTAEFQKRSNIRCESNIEEKNIMAGSEQATALFRIYQEILTNVARHSQASKVRVSLKAEGPDLVMVVKDNGRGIQPEQMSGTGSLGLLGMQERAAVLGGIVEINGQKGRGTTITVKIPAGQALAPQQPGRFEAIHT